MATKSISKKQIVESFVAFIDILGFGDLARSAKTPDELEKLYKSLDAIRREFEFRPRDKFKKEEHRAIKKRVLMFSDCIVTAMPLKSEYTRLTGMFDLFASELHWIALSQGICALQGHFVRGSVAIGLWYYRDQFLISPALATAYQLEQIIEQPIIAVTDALHTFLANSPDRRAYSAAIDPMNSLFKVYQNSKGQKIRYLDYIGLSVEAVVENVAGKSRAVQRRAAYGWLADHAASIRTAYANAPSGRPKRKFQWLAKYHNDYVSTHGGGPNHLLIEL